MTRKRTPLAETVYFSPQILMSVGDLTDALRDASHDFIFDLIVALEARQQDGDFLERVWKHFDAEMKSQQQEEAA